jgi:Diguanylate cyclase, GGDEF domain
MIAAGKRRGSSRSLANTNARWLLRRLRSDRSGRRGTMRPNYEIWYVYATGYNPPHSKIIQDITARYGGEEFAGRAAQHRAPPCAVGRQPAPPHRQGEEFKKKSSAEILGRVTISVGLSLLRPNDHTDALIERAEACLNAAKRAGRNPRHLRDRSGIYGRAAQSDRLTQLDARLLSRGGVPPRRFRALLGLRGLARSRSLLDRLLCRLARL